MRHKADLWGYLACSDFMVSSVTEAILVDLIPNRFALSSRFSTLSCWKQRNIFHLQRLQLIWKIAIWAIKRVHLTWDVISNPISNCPPDFVSVFLGCWNISIYRIKHKCAYFRSFVQVSDHISWYIAYCAPKNCIIWIIVFIYISK